MRRLKQYIRFSHRARYTLVMGALLSLNASTAYSFGILNNHGVLSQNAEHEFITRGALAQFSLGPETLDLIAGKTGGAGAIGAPDIYLPWKSRAHCDGGDYMAIADYPHTRSKADKRLRKCREWIFENLDKAVKRAGKMVDEDGKVKKPSNPEKLQCVFNGLRGRAKCNVLEKMGYAMHASQDFYSHSNWTDLPDATMVLGFNNPPGLGNLNPSLWLNPRHRQETVPAQLISGCFSLNPLGCKDRVSHGDLNKDTGLTKIQLTPLVIAKGTTQRGQHNGNFERAVRAAIMDSADKWAYFEEQVKIKYPGKRGELIICAVRNDDPAICDE